jgi:hypothetical protein
MTELPADLNNTLVHRAHEAEGCLSRVWYSPCDAYRYGLSRVWDARKSALLFIMLNPSTADEHRNDPTVARCETRARAMGFGGVMIANLFAFRATRPQDLKRAALPVGDANDRLLDAWAGTAAMTVAAWGVHGSHQGRAQQVARGLKGDLHHLGLTKDGHPRHPLYVPFATVPAPWPQTQRYPSG